MHHVHWVLIDLLNYQFDHSLAPNVVLVPYIYLRVYLEVFDLFGLLYLPPFLLSLLPFQLDGLRLAALHQLVDDLIHLEALYQ